MPWDSWAVAAALLLATGLQLSCRTQGTDRLGLHRHWEIDRGRSAIGGFRCFCAELPIPRSEAAAVDFAGRLRLEGG